MSTSLLCHGFGVRGYRYVPRVECRDCQLVRQVELTFAEPRRHFTRSFDRYALELSLHMTISDAAEHLGVSGDVVKEIQKQYLQRRFAKPRLIDVKRIAIDEIPVGKGHRYLTIVLRRPRIDGYLAGAG